MDWVIQVLPFTESYPPLNVSEGSPISIVPWLNTAPVTVTPAVMVLKTELGPTVRLPAVREVVGRKVSPSLAAKAREAVALAGLVKETAIVDQCRAVAHSREGPVADRAIPDGTRLVPLGLDRPVIREFPGCHREVVSLESEGSIPRRH